MPASPVIKYEPVTVTRVPGAPLAVSIEIPALTAGVVDVAGVLTVVEIVVVVVVETVVEVGVVTGGVEVVKVVEVGGVQAESRASRRPPEIIPDMVLFIVPAFLVQYTRTASRLALFRPLKSRLMAILIMLDCRRVVNDAYLTINSG
jgi:hypothetical protein